MPSLDALEILVAVARHGTLSSVAREVGVSEQAISSRIASLEKQTGLPLVTRTRRGAELTPAGRLTVSAATGLLELAEQLDTALSDLRGDRQVRVRVSASMTIAERLLPNWLASMQQENLRSRRPPFEFDFEASNFQGVVDRVSAAEADVGFVGGPHMPSNLGSKVVAHDRLTMVVTADHPWAQGHRRIHAKELADIPLITREGGSGQRQALRVALRSAFGRAFELPQPLMVLPSNSVVREAVLSGAGPAILSDLAVGDDIASGTFYEVPVDGIDLHRPIRAIWAGAAEPPAGAVADLISYIVAHPTS